MLHVSRAGAVRLIPASTWDVWGGHDPDSWSYRADVEGPSGNRTLRLPAAAVVHTRYAVDPRRPWQGLPPTSYASATGVLLSNIEKRLGQEAGGPVGHLIPIPQDGGDGEDGDPLATLKQTVGKLAGKVALVETTAAGWGEGLTGAPRTDWKAQRFGANPPPPLVTLRSDAANAVLAACGVPVALVSDADGTSQREAWRRFVMGALEPVAACLAGELSAKLETPVSFGFGNLWAHDLAGRAQAFGALTDEKLSAAEARRVAGI